MSRPGPPPPPGSRERRKHERFELLAQIELRYGDEVSILPVSNISAGGVAVTLSPGQLPGVAMREEVNVFIHHEGHEVTGIGEVVRIGHGGGGKLPSFALMWTSEDPEFSTKLGALLASLKRTAD